MKYTCITFWIHNEFIPLYIHSENGNVFPRKVEKCIRWPNIIEKWAPNSRKIQNTNCTIIVLQKNEKCLSINEQRTEKKKKFKCIKCP